MIGGSKYIYGCSWEIEKMPWSGGCLFKSLNMENKAKSVAYALKAAGIYEEACNCLVPQSYGISYEAIREVNLWAIYTTLTPRQRLESEKKYKSLKRASLS
jgi:hypothetical protein